MISFKKFLIEGWNKRIIGDHWHIDNIHGHDVAVYFNKGPERYQKHYKVHFTVNSSLHHPENSFNKHAPQILKHVKGVIHDFIKKENPHTLKFSAYDDNIDKQNKKEHLYRYMAKGYDLKQHRGENDYSIKLREEIFTLLKEHWEKDDYTGSFHHTKFIGSQEITTNFEPHEDHPGSYEISFNVDGNLGKPLESKRNPNSLKIIRHVKSIAKEFIKTHNPKNLTYSAYDYNSKLKKKKDKLYNQMTKNYDVKEKDTEFGKRKFIKLREIFNAY